MHLRIAEFEDSVHLSEFFKKFPIEGWAQLKIDRGGKYFEPYQVQSEQFLTYILSEKDNEIHGTATFIIQSQMFQGNVQPIAWGRDLRVNQSRQAILEWSKHYLPVMEEVEHAFGVQHMFTVLNLMDTHLMNTFVRSRSLKRPLPRYHLYRRFNLTTLHGRFPGCKNPVPHIRVVRGTDEWKDALAHYVCEQSRKRDFSQVWTSDLFFEKMNKCKGMRIRDFYIAIDKNKNIIGCAAPWSPGGLQELIPISYSSPAHNFRQFLKFGKLLGWTHPLTKPFERTQLEAPLNFKYVNFLYAAHEDIFESLLHNVFDDLAEDEFIAYTQMRSDFMYRKPPGWIASQTPYGIFSLLSPDQEPPSFLHPKNETPAELDAFFI